LGIRLLTRTTRGVSPTEAGERLLANIAPYYEGIETELAALTELRDKPAGTIRITATEYAAVSILWPKLAQLLPDYPDIKVEISINYGLVDIVAERFDAGVRFGNQVAKDMIAVRISSDIRLAVVAAPAYAAKRGLPQTPQDLTAHDCINLRLPTYGGLLPWEFSKDGQSLQVRVQGQLVFNSLFPILKAALEGFGLAHVPEGLAQEHIAAGRLVPVLEAYWPTLPGYHLYYPSRRQVSPAFALLVNALRN
jgi:DNA-binding transcriptional LysR family regulator